MTNPVESDDEDVNEYIVPDKESNGSSQALEILPHVAAIHPCQIHSLCATKNMKWIFTGGEDGFIRKYDFAASLKGEQSLTLVQRHGLVDMISKAGVLSSAWENEEPVVASNSPKPIKYSPVYSMDVHSEGVWLVSGTEGGAINLYTVRHEEGLCHHTMKQHSKAVSVLVIAPEEKTLLSGSWDKTIALWDLNNGQVIRQLKGPNTQITSLAFKPSSADTYKSKDPNIVLGSSYDGTCWIFDLRTEDAVVKIPANGCPPWSLSSCWSADGSHIYVGRRNSSDIRYTTKRQAKSQVSQGIGACLVCSLHEGWPEPHLVIVFVANWSSSNDNIRLWNLALDPEAEKQKSIVDPMAVDGATTNAIVDENVVVQFSIIPGHHGGMVSSLLLDENNDFLFSASGNRGYSGPSSNTCLFYGINKR